MKKYIYRLILIACLFVIMGFRGCGVLADFILSLFVYHATGEFIPLGDGESELYSIAVGKGGVIYTRDGRPPASWVETQSGTSQNLNFVRVYKNSDSLIAYAVGDGGTVLLSRDKGLTWEDRSIPSLSTNLYGVDFLYFASSSTNVVVCGDSGVVIN